MLIAKQEAKMAIGGICREFYLCDEICEDHERFNWDTYRWETIESETSQRYFVKNLQGLTAADRVNLYINSMGGSVKEALGIYNVLQRCSAEVYAYIDGFAASAASIIAMAAVKVIMPRNTAMMIHNASWWAYGNPEALRKSAEDLEVINMAAIQSYVSHAGDKLPEDKLKKMLDEETWLTAEDCMACGLADEYGEQDVDIQAAAQNFKAQAAAAAKGQAVARITTPPAFLAEALREPPAASAQPKTREPQGNPPENHSGVYMLLKSMTMEE